MQQKEKLRYQQEYKHQHKHEQFWRLPKASVLGSSHMLKSPRGKPQHSWIFVLEFPINPFA